ncbi:hypothetical protein TNCV_2595001 [Trichonephila clavipes]|nr:hypothetical protein TNCV_2595001 [Trichonephila clavipes]
MQKESDPVDDETEEDENKNNNESSKGPSNADAFSALEASVECRKSFVRLVQGEERWEDYEDSQGAFPQNWGGYEQNRTSTFMVLKAKANDRR